MIRKQEGLQRIFPVVCRRSEVHIKQQFYFFRIESEARAYTRYYPESDMSGRAGGAPVELLNRVTGSFSS